MNNVLFISFSDCRYDGRLRELLKIAQNIGDLYSVVRFQENCNEKNISLSNNGSVFEFIRKAMKLAENMPSVDIIFIDNRMACIPGLILQRKYPKAKIVQDVRELYVLSEQKRIKSKIGCYVEQIMYKHADVMICANKYRAQIMKESYGLSEEPLVYENVRKLNYSSGANLEALSEKYNEIFSRKTKKIITTSGWDIKRTNDKLVDAMRNFPNHDLVMVGGGSEKDKAVIQDIIEKNNLSNVFFIGKVGEDELKYLLSNCHIGVVNYGKYDTNNRYCASGKIYEFLFEGCPVVTTENIPLMEFCKENGVGESDDYYVTAIRKITENYDFYKENIKKFEELDVEENNYRIKEKIKGKLGIK